MSAPFPEPELSRCFAVPAWGTTIDDRRIEARPEECAALARRFDLVAIGSLEAHFTLAWIEGGARLEAVLDAAVTQRCVVTLEPVVAAIEDAFVIEYHRGIGEEEADRLTLDALDDAVIDPLVGETIDVGEAVAQHLAISLDPFPRAGGADATAKAPEPPEATDRVRPFAALLANRPKT